MLGNSAVNLSLLVGIFPYILKLLQSPASDIRQVLVSIWARIIGFDPSCRQELVRDKSQAYFIQYLLSPDAQPVQRAMTVALGDDAHVAAEKAIYRARREVLLPAIKNFGFEVHASQAGLYIWATLGEDCWKTVDRMAEIGILVAPGIFYGEASKNFVRFALTATDERIAEGAKRLEATRL
jgi:aspartate/methionine/tyrosine aminotransferase